MAETHVDSGGFWGMWVSNGEVLSWAQGGHLDQQGLGGGVGALQGGLSVPHS